METKDSFNIFAKVLFIFAGLIFGFILIRLFFIPVKINNVIMEPALHNNDYAWFYKTRKVDTGSIVLYKSPLSGKQVGRVIAKSGDTIEIINKRIYVNGIPLHIHWKIVQKDTRTFPPRFTVRDNLAAITVPNGHIFVICDNWDIPTDSRLFGTIPLNAIVGKYIWKLSPKL
ncbi:MAG TPA: signal peptidase I [Spirochaetota bacterium]|nr:signal peptidase I [Spirochaetota bacterium]HQK07142.1 signal peptidase I [Spirochaetota bacterium]